jgi:transcriptional regulator with XRE-family HTH domain
MIDTWEKERFGRRMQNVREMYGYSLADAGAISGVDRQYIHRFEKGKIQHPSYPLLIQYATKTYPMTPSDLAGFAELWNSEEKDPLKVF